MSREISMAFIYDCSESNTSFLGERRFWTVFKGEHLGKVDRLLFSSFSHLRLYKDVNECDQNVIAYYPKKDTENRRVTNLMRREKVRIDGEPEDGGREMILCPDIESLHFKFWDEKREDWIDEWNCTQSERLNRLPKLVRINLSVISEQGLEIPFTTIARIFTTQPLMTWIKPSQ
jgi:general secretion pathway protein J